MPASPTIIHLFFILALCASWAKSSLLPFEAVDGEQLVTTPGGKNKIPQSQVYAIPAGGRIHRTFNSILIADANGNVTHTRPFPSPNNTATLTARAATATSTTACGWVAYANWVDHTGSPVKLFNSTWTVPPIPNTDHGQTLYFFNSIMPPGLTYIIQPVLQYGLSPAGGGSYWAVASWYVGEGSAYYTPLVRVYPGQQLQGVLTRVIQPNASTFTYQSTFANVPGSQVLSFFGVEELVWLTETLEVYGAQMATDFPSGMTSFTKINIKTIASNNPAGSWFTTTNTAAGFQTVIVKNGSVNAQIDVSYP